ncbi:MFS transporter [Streptomyces sp. ITFR-16]|uniref:MFS transporter n=1 Tax=Streptomyces sp. ITFR-16 TaxID=3075198 RepID=UPI00288AFBFF|nr:MFS transporter [Streptomyces sp. ITFR-16]WNI26437.1 MFS transporter [Streptomyces sp. ITFR-16]
MAGGDAPSSLWRDRDYRVFLGVQTLSALGDSFSYVAIPLLVLHSTGSVVQMGAVTGLTGVSSIVTGLFAGVIADRVDRRRLLMAADGVRCLLYALIPLVWLFAAPMWLIYTVVPVVGAFAMLFQVTYVTVVPALVGPDRIARANGHLFATYAAAGVAGPALAGFVAGAAGPAAAVGIDSLSFAVSAVGLLFVRVRAKPGGDAVRAERGTVGREFLAGARFLWEHPVLRPLTLLLSLLTFLTYGLTDLVVYLLKHDLGRPDTTVGYVLAAGTAGTFVASTMVARVRERLGFGASWIGASALAGVAVTFLGLARSVPVVAVLMTVNLMCNGVAGISSMSLRQEVTPGHLLGRVTSTFWTVHSALGPLGAAAATAAAAGFGAPAVFVGIGAAGVLTALAGTVTGIGRRAGGGAAAG